MNMESLKNSQIVASIVRDNWWKFLDYKGVNKRKKLKILKIVTEERLNIDPKGIVEYFIRERDDAIKSIEKRNKYIGVSLYNYCSLMLSTFKEEALRDNLVTFYLRLLRRLGENNYIDISIRKGVKKIQGLLYKKLAINLKGKQERPNIFKWSDEYDEVYRRLKQINKLKSGGNKEINLRKYLKKYYGKFNDSDINKITCESFVRDKALKIIGLKYNRDSKVLKDWLWESNMIKQIATNINKIKFEQEISKIPTILGRRKIT